MARYRTKDDVDLRWNRVRRRLTRELDTQVADWREDALNRLLGGAWEKFKDALQLLPEECAYWAQRFESEGANTLGVEINAANTELVRLLESCATAEERVLAKERYCRDAALDSYQHCFRLDELPESVWDSIQAQEDDAKRAAEILLNHDKAIRFVLHERDNARRKRGA